jgi:hypothetical protein
MPRESGASSTPWLLGSITDVSGILDHPLSRVTTTFDVDASETRIALSINASPTSKKGGLSAAL